MTVTLQLIRVSFAFLFYFIAGDAIAQSVDTTSANNKIPERKARYFLTGSLSASYVTFKNWEGENHTSLTFLSNVDYRHRLTKGTGWTHEHQIKAELGFINYTDSIWVKSNDQFRIAMQWNEKPGKYLTHSYSFLLQSQFLNSYRYTYSDDGVLQRQKKGWILAPGTMELAYGLNWRFWEQCRINTAFATLRIKAIPKEVEFIPVERMIETSRKIIKTEYGFSTQIYINKEFYDKHLLWDHQSRLFFNALDKKSIYVDFNNRFTLRFLKFMQFRIDSQIIYDPDFSTRPSFRQDFLLGLFYELRK
jgi:Protein of unknown function (DUF3078)